MIGKIYNIYRILHLMKGGELVTFDCVFENFKTNYPVVLSENKHPSILLDSKPPFYVKPQLSQLHSSNEAKIILISAPGATGKSALARHLSSTYNSIHWNLADISLGDSSFIGTLVRSLGVEKYSDYACNLLSGNTLLIVDAFDEAEMRSGPKAVKSFLLELGSTILTATKPCAILLSRAETAQSICAVYEDAGIPIAHYEISFFEESASEDFVYQKVSQIQEEKRISKGNPSIVRQCIKQYLENIKSLVHEDEQRSFIGYAPVLEVIGEHIAQENNAYSFLMSIRDSSSLQGIDVVSQIVEKLLTREQSKVCDAFRNKIESRMTERDSIDFSTLYNANEQLNRILSYVVFGEFDPDSFSLEMIPGEFIDDYIEILRTFLPQHPFVRDTSKNGIEFAGPAFRDYALAELMHDITQSELVECYFDEKRISDHFPSHLLWKFYTRTAPETVNANQVSYLFESYKSEARQPFQAHLSISGSKDGGYTASWSLSNPIDDINLDYESYGLEIDDCGIYLENLINTFIDVDCPVIVENKSRSIRITNSCVHCDRLEIYSDTLIIDAHDDSVCELVSKNDAVIKSRTSANTEMIVNGNKLSIDFPNHKRIYRLMKYQQEFSEDSEFSIELFVYLLRKIFVQFRKHKKDTPARDAEKIDFVVIGSGEHRRSVFDYLCAQRVIFKDAHLYKINIDQMASVGISWGAVTRGDCCQLDKVYKGFNKWLTENKK